MVPSDKILPPPDILKKIQVVDAAAPHDLIQRAGKIMEERRQKELIELYTVSSGFITRLSNAFRSMATISPPVPMPDSAERINQSWVAVGNALRAAIREYLDQNPKIIHVANITADDLKALEEIPLKHFKPAQHTP